LRLTALDNWPEIAAAVQYRAAELADYLRVGLRKLQRDYRRQLGITPQQHLNQLRSERIKELARQNKRIKEIRAAIHYKQDAQVGRLFVHSYGIPLRQFRQARSVPE